MLDDGFGARVFEQVGMPSVVGIAIAGFLALLMSLLISTRHLRAMKVSPAVMLSPYILCLSGAAVLIARQRMGDMDHLALYGLAFPSFLLFFPVFCAQVMILAPLAYKGVTGAKRQWRHAALSALPLVLAAGAAYSGAIKVGAGEALQSLGVQFDANGYGALRSVLYVGVGGLVGLACLTPMVDPHQVAHRRALALGVTAMVIAGELSGYGLGLYVLAQNLPGLVEQGGVPAMDLIYQMSLIEAQWGWFAGTIMLGSVAVYTRWLWVTEDGTHVPIERLEYLTMSIVGLLLCGTATGLFVQREEVAQVFDLLMGA